MLDRTTVPDGLIPAREPIFKIPAVILFTLVVLLLIHAIRLVIPDALDFEVLARLAFVPGRLTYLFDPEPVVNALMRLAAGTPEALQQAQVGRYFLRDGVAQPWTVLTYGLLHANWTHLGLNSVWLLAFGSPVARRVGPWRCLALLGVTTLAGALAHWLTHPFDLQPVIGASAAVSGCMGASLRFIFQPRRTLASIVGLTAPERQAALGEPRVPLAALLRDRRAVGFFVAWFVTNLMFGLGAVSLGLSDAAVAWEAHIGGFLAGLVLFPLFDPKDGAPSAVVSTGDDGAARPIP